MKICLKCQIPKELSQFTTQKIKYQSKSGLKVYDIHLPSCKECRASKSKKDYHSNIQKAREYHKTKRARLKRENPNYVIAHRLRVRIRLALQNNPKTSSTSELLGCSLNNFKKHLESKFVDGMNWERFYQGQIHIDHVRPCSSFDLSYPQQQAECFHYLNLQPLWAKENLAKGDTWLPNDKNL
jgi:hypothetical protein